MKTKMNAKKLRAAELLAFGSATQHEIAGTLGVTDRTLRNWMQEPEFQAAQAECLNRVHRELMPKVFRRMRQVLEDGDDGAALKVIELAMKQAGWFSPRASVKPSPQRRSGIVMLPTEAFLPND